jgi:hypothetical protein
MFIMLHNALTYAMEIAPEDWGYYLANVGRAVAFVF